MSTHTFYQCDACGQKITEGDLLSIQVKVKGVGKNVSGFTVGVSEAKYDLCPNCADKQKLVKRVIKDDKIINENAVSTADQLYNILSQIVWENNPHQG